MSSFLSNKLLQYRKAGRRAVETIDADRFCTSCGYNVRGLTVGRNCPECGTAISAQSESGDFLFSGDWSERQHVKWGLTLVIIALLAGLSGRLVIFNWLVFANISAPTAAYRWFDLAVGAIWTSGLWLVTPRRLEHAMPQLRYLRLAARWLQWCWPLAAALGLLAAGQIAAGGSADGLLMLRGLAQAAAWGGAMCALYLLLRLADQAGLDDAASRINLALWLLPLPTVILSLVPEEVFWVALLLIGPLLLFWCWCLALLARGVLVMRQHEAWALRLAADAPNRTARQMETRKELDDAVAAQIRPTGPAMADLPLEPRHPPSPRNPPRPGRPAR